MKRGLKALDRILEPQEYLSRLIAFVEGDEDEDEGDDGTDTPPGGSETGTTPPPAGGTTDAAKPPRTAETNRMVKERVARDRAVRAKEAGFESYDALVAAAKKQKESDEANLSDLEKRNKDLTAATGRITAVEQENRSLKLRLALTQHLAAEAPHLIGKEKWILPHLLDAITDEDYDDEKALAKKIGATAKEFSESVGVTSNGTQRVGTGGGPPRTTGGLSDPMKAAARSAADGYLRNGAARFGARVVPRRE